VGFSHREHTSPICDLRLRSTTKIFRPRRTRGMRDRRRLSAGPREFQLIFLLGPLLEDMVFIKAWRAKIQTTPSRKKQKMNPGMGLLV
jgi:hypothetical protein